MRIVAGKFKGRKFNPPANNWPTRPTTDFAREALFNILTNDYYFDDIKVLELFGGSGSHSYELISRGCTDVTLVEQHNSCIKFIKKTIAELDVEDCIKIIRGDAFRFLEGCRKEYDYIFADPPYHMPTLDLLPNIVFEKKLLKKGGQFVLEHGNNHTFSLHPNFIKEKKYGNAMFSFFECLEEDLDVA
ncbi:MAG: 16S rRNA (guanine966-N2)-methyltransferase [Maribacter sp.]|jgi:16S rRNA (guanine966-N2)-methyltransferase